MTNMPDFAKCLIGGLVLAGSSAIGVLMVRSGHIELVWGTFSVQFATVVAYYFGSSAGSAAKTALLAQSGQPAASAPVAPAPDPTDAMKHLGGAA